MNSILWPMCATGTAFSKGPTAQALKERTRGDAKRNTQSLL